MFSKALAALALSLCVSASPIPTLAGRGEPWAVEQTAGQSSASAATQAPAQTAQQPAGPQSTSPPAGQSSGLDCTHGAFQCNDQNLQVCASGTWTTVQTCVKEQVCIASPYYNCVDKSYLDLFPNSTDSASNATSTSAASKGPTAAPSSGSNTTTPAPPANVTSGPPPNATGNSSKPTGGAPAGNWAAPHRVIYANLASKTETGFPDPDDLGDFNRLLISVYLSDGREAFDVVKMWAELDPAKRQALLDAYHARGIAVMFSLFGSTDEPTSRDKRDPVEFADEVADFALEYALDGVDVDYEDFTAANSGNIVAWLAPPIAPWFDATQYADGAYAGFDREAGDTVDFYNLQYYNQEGQYEDCKSVMVDSGATRYPKTSVKELHEGLGIPLEKLVLGKPVAEKEANSGFMSAEDLAKCFELNDFGWPESLMFWQWKEEEFLAAVLDSAGECEEWGAVSGAAEGEDDDSASSTGSAPSISASTANTSSSGSAPSASASPASNTSAVSDLVASPTPAASASAGASTATGGASGNSQPAQPTSASADIPRPDAALSTGEAPPASAAGAASGESEPSGGATDRSDTGPSPSGAGTGADLSASSGTSAGPTGEVTGYWIGGSASAGAAPSPTGHGTGHEMPMGL